MKLKNNIHLGQITDENLLKLSRSFHFSIKADKICNQKCVVFFVCFERAVILLSKNVLEIMLSGAIYICVYIYIYIYIYETYMNSTCRIYIAQSTLFLENI